MTQKDCNHVNKFYSTFSRHITFKAAWPFVFIIANDRIAHSLITVPLLRAASLELEPGFDMGSRESQSWIYKFCQARSQHTRLNPFISTTPSKPLYVNRVRGDLANLWDLIFFYYRHVELSVFSFKGAQALDILRRDFCSNLTYMDRLVRN
jgi:hypothetical protein